MTRINSSPLEVEVKRSIFKAGYNIWRRLSGKSSAAFDCHTRKHSYLTGKTERDSVRGQKIRLI